jgi:hypothetical protein
MACELQLIYNVNDLMFWGFEATGDCSILSKNAYYYVEKMSALSVFDLPKLSDFPVVVMKRQGPPRTIASIIFIQYGYKL